MEFWGSWLSLYFDANPDTRDVIKSLQNQAGEFMVWTKEWASWEVRNVCSTFNGETRTC